MPGEHAARHAEPREPRDWGPGEYAPSGARARAPTGTALPLPSPAAARPSTVPPTTHTCAIPSAKRPAASGRSPAGWFTRSAAPSHRSLRALPAAPNPTAASAANPSTWGVVTAPRAIQPPASTPSAASTRFGARTSRSTSRTEDLLVQPFVARHDAIGRELEGAPRRRVPEARVQRGVAQDPNAVGDP